MKARDPKVDDYVRMFMMPGVLHCGGGAGPDNADWAAAIDGWVESGKAPERMIAQKGTGAAVTRTRPLCAYPQHAVYTRNRQHRSSGELRLQAVDVGSRVRSRRARRSRGDDVSCALSPSSLAIVVADRRARRMRRRPRRRKRSFDAANDAWERGDYIAALNGYIQVVNAPGGDAFFEPIALTTGELFETRELTADGRAPRFSPDGKFIAYETGLETSRRTQHPRKQRRVGQRGTPVADLPGVSATFSSTLNQVAYLRIPDNDEIRARVGRDREGVADGAESQSADADADLAHREARRRSSSAI